MSKSETPKKEYTLFVDQFIRNQLPDVASNLSRANFGMDEAIRQSDNAYELAVTNHVLAHQRIAILDTSYGTRLDAPTKFFDITNNIRGNGIGQAIRLFQSGYYLRTGDADEARYFLEMATDLTDDGEKGNEQRQKLYLSYTNAALTLENVTEVEFGMSLYEQTVTQSAGAAQKFQSDLLQMTRKSDHLPDIQAKLLTFLEPNRLDVLKGEQLLTTINNDGIPVDVEEQVDGIIAPLLKVSVYSVAARKEFQRNNFTKGQEYISKARNLITNDLPFEERFSANTAISRVIISFDPDQAWDIHRQSLAQIEELTDSLIAQQAYGTLFTMFVKRDGNEETNRQIKAVLDATYSHLEGRFTIDNQRKLHREYLLAVFPFDQQPAYETLSMLERDYVIESQTREQAKNLSGQAILVSRMCEQCLNINDLNQAQVLIEKLTAIQSEMDKFFGLHTHEVLWIEDFTHPDQLRTDLVLAAIKTGSSKSVSLYNAIENPANKLKVLWDLYTSTHD